MSTSTVEYNEEDAESSSSTASLVLDGILIEGREWRMVGKIPADDEHFSAIVKEECMDGGEKDGIVCGGLFYTINVRSFTFDDFTGEEQEVCAIGNGEHFTDEDGDFDYERAGMPELVWQLVYGKIFAPVADE